MNLVQATMPFTIENRRLSWYYFLSTLILVVAAYGGTILFTPLYLKAIASVLAGLLMTRMFVIYHDFQHEAIFRRSTIMKIFMTLFGIIALAPVSIWDESHEHHHHNNSKFSTFVVGSFPVVSTKTFVGLSKAGRIKYLVIRHPLMIVFAYVPIFLVSFCLWPFFESPRKYWDCGVAAVVHVLIAAGLYFYGGFQMLLFTILIPSLLMYALGGYIFYAQHNFPKVFLRDNEHWDYLDAALNSSSYIRMNRVMRWFTANIGFHHIHHVNPRIPFYRLPEVMMAFPELQKPRDTSLGVLEVSRCLNLKLWDEDLGRMICMKEFHRRAQLS
ncbi:MAG TPA: fatty acid desaturase [Cyclobacteriaceae bacterium]|nr:fatty acid desaturase [Cyclobacteriaceae bacterium]